MQVANVMLRTRLGRLSGWIEQQSTAVRVGVLLAAFVAFSIIQVVAGAVEGGADAVVLLLGPPTIVAALLTLYVIFATLRSFVRGVLGTTEPGSEA